MTHTLAELDAIRADCRRMVTRRAAISAATAAGERLPSTGIRLTRRPSRPVRELTSAMASSAHASHDGP